MAIQGLRHTGNFAADERPKNWREGILRSSINGKMPLLGLTAAMKSRKVDDAEFNWWDKERQTRRLALGADLTAPAAGTIQSLTVGSGALGLKEGDMLFVEGTGEILVVNADPTADTGFSVVRGYAGSTPAAVDIDAATVNPNIVVLGSANEEGSDAPSAVGFDPAKKYNYTQIFRDTLEATRTALKTRLRTADQAKEAKAECLEIHGMGIERQFFFGRRWEGTKNGKPIRTTGGVTNFIDSGNIVTADATTDMEALEEYLYSIFRYGSSEKLAITGNRALLTIGQIIRKNTAYQMIGAVKEYNMTVSRLICPFGELVLKTHPLLNASPGGVNSGTNAYYGLDSWLFVLDMAELVYTFIDDTQYEPKLQDNGADGMKSGYLTECGLEIHHPKHHYLIKGLRGAAVDA